MIINENLSNKLNYKKIGCTAMYSPPKYNNVNILYIVLVKDR